MRSWLGLLRSLAIYYGNPLRRRGLSRFYRGIMAPGDLAFDVGAHVGNRTRALRAAGARVVAVEPQAPFAGFLRATLPRDVTLVEAALGPAEGQGVMAVSSLHPTVSSLAPGFEDEAARVPGFGHVRWDRRQPVAVTTLDALIARHGLPAFLKIDVEGFEPQVLAGLTQAVPLVALEYLPGMTGPTEAALDRLASLGRYRFNVVQGEAGAYLWPEWQTDAALRDWLRALPPGSRSGDLYARLQDGAGDGAG